MHVHLRKAKILVYITVALAALNSFWFEVITSDYAHEIFSKYFFVELVILLTTIFIGFETKWAKILFAFLELIEIWFFFLDASISPDETLMLIIFGLRVYIFVLLLRAKAD